jgi:hypothetical protein
MDKFQVVAYGESESVSKLASLLCIKEHSNPPSGVYYGVYIDKAIVKEGDEEIMFFTNTFYTEDELKKFQKNIKTNRIYNLSDDNEIRECVDYIFKMPVGAKVG